MLERSIFSYRTHGELIPRQKAQRESQQDYLRARRNLSYVVQHRSVS